MILIVLPDEGLAQSVGHFLEQDGWRPEILLRGKEAIASFADRVPVAIMAPTLLADMPGPKVLKEARFKFGPDLVTLLLAEGQNATALKVEAQASALVDPKSGLDGIRAALGRFSDVTGIQPPEPRAPTAADLGTAPPAPVSAPTAADLGAASQPSQPAAAPKVDGAWADNFLSGASSSTPEPEPADDGNPFAPGEEVPLELDTASVMARSRAQGPPRPAVTGDAPAPPPPGSRATAPAPHVSGPAPLPDGVRLKFGTLQDMDPARVVGGVLRLSLTGQLIFQAGGERHTITVEQGVPIFASSTRPENRFGEFLIAKGLLTGDQLASAIHSVPAGQKLGEHLVNTGLVTQEQIDTSIVAHLQARLIGCFELREGQFGLNLGPVSPPTRSNTLPRPLELLRLGVHNFYQAEELARLFPMDTILRPIVPPRSLASLARLAETAVTLVERNDGKTPISQVLSDQASSIHGHQLFYALYAGGALAVVRT